ncbi:MAG: N-glycosylase/DNA lyase [Candidatus Omnitrophica bacterium]|nr:N-glycosylase/DNA lyase [Candidatus Omnitrophota bacterium]
MGKDNANLIILKKLYQKKKAQIISRLDEFKKILNKSEKHIFKELCFCILTPQSKAKVADRLINRLYNSGLLFKANKFQLQKYLKPIRFYKKKSEYIVNCRKKIFLEQKIKDFLTKNNPLVIRNWLIKNIKGIGYKEASHFLRNIGLGENLAILDRHILKNLKKYGVIKKIPKTLTPKRYLKIEEGFKKFSDKINIPLSHLDLLFWSLEAGEIFK